MIIQFIPVQSEHMKLILHWRTSEEVTRYMFTDIENDLDKQYQWWSRVSSKPTERYWLVQLKKEPIGLVSLNQIDEMNRRCSWAYYIGEQKHRIVGGMIPPYIYSYVFDFLKLNKVVAEVMEGNEAARRMHQAYGCREAGLLKEHIFKYGSFHDVYQYEMLRSGWETLKKKCKRFDLKAFMDIA
ncbi:UDP-4-amino-4,6-dideoxy-N-acetyl-beta-L-altrosamine N-acetyltransferase [Bacillus cereus]|nr:MULTISPECIES: UDP-4-amino-4,6-dideoxy-N-acetyl-beta-L-altrosamine N-acetyltransferase [Paenibacillus]MEB9894624.1 UDP-4-amino-4,6-dideoxy-N-acetyl-beta-L-altrosamine N-acetyltransferase [Bacillus cereus]